MHHARAANKWAHEADHEIDHVISRQDTQVAHAWPEWIPPGQCPALLQPIVVRKHATLRTPARARRIHDASHVFALSLHKLRVTFAAKFFPAIRPAQVRARRSFGHQHNLGPKFWK